MDATDKQKVLGDYIQGPEGWTLEDPIPESWSNGS